VEKTTIYLPMETQEALRALARRTGRSQAAIIREAVDVYVQQQARPQPRSIGIGHNPSLQARKTEEWLEANFRPE
jgi:hypothetical protein